MLSVLLAVGLGIDISRLYLSKTELQNAADAAALAGVSGLNGHGPGITEAANRAVAAMNSRLSMAVSPSSSVGRVRLTETGHTGIF